MGLFEDYQKELEEDTKIDLLNVKDVQLRLPAIKHKWAARLINHRLNLNKKESLLRTARKTLLDKGLNDPKVKLSKITVSNNIEEHEVILKLKDQIAEETLIIEYLEKSEKILGSITYDLKNLTELMKLEQL